MMDRFLTSSRVLPVLILVASTNTPGCASTQGNLQAHGRVAQLTWTARVDHPIARDYLEGRPLPSDLEEIRRAHLIDGLLPAEPTLSYLTDRYSADVATLFFTEAVSGHEPSDSIQREYADAVRRLMQTGEIPEVDSSGSRLTVAFAPGWFYKSHGAETGGDFHRQLEQLARVGVPAVLIETDENGTVESNAEKIGDALRRLQREGREVLVVSASKSGAEVAVALGEVLGPDETTSRRRPRFANLRFPEQVLLVSYVPVPLSGDISNRGAFGYSRMRHLGPNDGLTMLIDQLLPGGLTIVETGVDHFFDHPDRELRSLALLEVLLKQIGVADSV